MSVDASRPEHLPSSVRTLSIGNLVDSPNVCPVCRTVPLTGKQTVCSGRCRIKRYRQRREAQRRDRDARARLLLTTALEAITEAREMLQETP